MLGPAPGPEPPVGFLSAAYAKIWLGSFQGSILPLPPPGNPAAGRCGNPSWPSGGRVPSPAHSSRVGRETLLRLQLENKRLCQQEAADRERQEELQRHLEEANRARHGLETQHR